MALSCDTLGYAHGTVDQGAHTSGLTLNGQCSATNPHKFGVTKYGWFDYGYAAVGENTTQYGELIPEGGGPFPISAALTRASDEDHVFRAVHHQYGTGNTVYGSTLGVKTRAVTATADTPAAGTITADGAILTCDFFPNTADSTVTAKFQHREDGETIWTDDTASGYATSGYAETTATATLTGLDPETTYEYRFVVTRTTVNETTLTGSIVEFTTAADEPQVTTAAASSVGSTSATLNATIDPNGITCIVRFGYGDNDAGSVQGNWDNVTSLQEFSGDGDQAVSASLGAGFLTSSTLYYFRAFVDFPYPGLTDGNSGSTLSFTTASDPAAEAALEDHLLIFDFDAVYGVQKAFVFLAASPAASSSDKFLSAAAPWSAAECQVTKDGGAAANATNAPTRIGSTAFYTITLTAAELTAENTYVWITDSGNAARDVLIRVRTSQQLGKQIINAAAYAANDDAVTLTPHGTGRGLRSSYPQVLDEGTFAAASGTSATLGTNAAATADYYNNCTLIVTSGTGAGQARVIQDYSAAKVATVTAWATTPTGATYTVVAGAQGVWDQLEGPEPTTVLEQAGDGSTFRKLMQWFKRRRFNRNIQTATTQTVYRDDASTTLAARSVSDNGTTQEQGEFS